MIIEFVTGSLLQRLEPDGFVRGGEERPFRFATGQTIPITELASGLAEYRREPVKVETVFRTSEKV
jgi:hypothetical protein